MKMLLPACFLIVFIGLFPKIFIDRVSPTVMHVLTVDKNLKVEGEAEEGTH